MRFVEPEVFLIGRPKLDYYMVMEYLKRVDGLAWFRRLDLSNHPELNDAQNLVEFEGRLCYRSWEPGLNPNVTRVREDQGEYLENILGSYHGSVLEHATFNFVIHDASRVFTHEMVRHSIGTAVSQESLRFVRVEEIPFWLPEWAREDSALVAEMLLFLSHAESLQRWMAEHFGLDDEGVSFAEKKVKTSFMRRFLPEGVATGMGWSANVRALRHVIETRTAPGVEEEIRIIAAKIGEIMKAEAPLLFGDYTVEDGAWIPAWRKV